MIENILSSVVQCQKKKLQHKLLLKMVKDKTKVNFLKSGFLCKCSLTLDTLKSVFIFSILFSLLLRS